MKRFLLISTLVIAFPILGRAQTPTADSPATKDDIERYFQVMHVRDTMKQMMDVMAKQAHQMARGQISKNAANLPPDFEERTNKMLDEELKNFPLDEVLQAMIPVYQKHWTRVDVDAIIAFYSTPTGQKVLRELPATMAEAMQVVQPIMQKRMSGMMERLQQEVAQTIKESKTKTTPSSQATPN